MKTTMRAMGALAVLSTAHLAAPQGISAQNTSPDTTAATNTTQASQPARDNAVQNSPRTTLEQFLTATRAGRFELAATFLDIPDSLQQAAPELARELKAVLDRYLWIDLDKYSGTAIGDTADGLDPSLEQVGIVTGADGVRTSIRLSRTIEDPNSQWKFSRGTVTAIPSLFDRLPDRWIVSNLPLRLLRPGPFDILWWQWIALPVLLAISFLIGPVLGRIVRSVATRVVARTTTTWDDAVIEILGKPANAAISLAVFAALVPWLALYQPATDATFRIIRVAYFVVFFWAAWRLIDVAGLLIGQSQWATASPSSRALLPIASRVFKVIVLAFAAVAMLSILGYPVASLIAGLGLGGLAFALAAQKTVENLFGAFSIGVDRPFSEGDFVRIEDFVGTVESLGLRSTRFRTLDRTLITLPNGRLADMRIESYSVRDRMRLATTIGLVYETTAPQMREVLAGFENALRSHPKIWPDAVNVRFAEFGASSLDINIMAWFQTTDSAEFELIRQEVLLKFMEVVEKAGSGFAFPTQTLHVASLPATDGNGHALQLN